MDVSNRKQKQRNQESDVVVIFDVVMIHTCHLL